MTVSVIAFGVFGHHMLTINHERSAFFGLAANVLVAVTICMAVVGAAKKEKNLIFRVSAALVLIAAGCLFLDSLRSPVFPAAYKAASVASGAILALFGIFILFASKKVPNQTAKPTLAGRQSG